MELDKPPPSSALPSCIVRSVNYRTESSAKSSLLGRTDSATCHSTRSTPSTHRGPLLNLLLLQLLIILLLSTLPQNASASPLWYPASIEPRNIRNLPCVSKKTQETGICMFAFACFKANGTHLGTCIDRFYFGSCCQLPDNYDPNAISNEVLVHETHPNPLRPHPTRRPTTNATISSSIGKPGITASNSMTTTRRPIVTRPTIKPVPSKPPSGTGGKPSATTTPKPTSVSNTAIGTNPNKKPPVLGDDQVLTTTQITPGSTNKPTSKPALSRPTSKPTVKPTLKPVTSTGPTVRPTQRPGASPTIRPISKPSSRPTKPPNRPAQKPTTPSTQRPSSKPTVSKPPHKPSQQPSSKPSTPKPASQQQASKPTIRPSVSKPTSRPTTPKPATSKPTTSKPTTPKPTTPKTTTPRTTTPRTTTPKSTTPKPTTPKPTTPTPTTPKPSSQKPVTHKPPSKPSPTSPTIQTAQKPSQTASIPPSSSTAGQSSSASPVTTASTLTTQSETGTKAPSTTSETQTQLSNDIPPVKPEGPSGVQAPEAVEEDTNVIAAVGSTQATTSGQGTTPSAASTSAPETTLTTVGQTDSAVPSATTQDSQPTTSIANTTSPTATSNKTDSTTTSPETLTTTQALPGSENLNMTNYREVCGRRLVPTSRIVGGAKSTFGKWPWQISLRQWRTSTYLHKCGAALLNENWAITAAHCVENVPPGDLLLRLGEHDLSTETEPLGHLERRVQLVASHPQFDPRTFEYDLALLRFYEPVLPFAANVLPICVPEDDRSFVGSTAYVTGWGRLYEDGPLPSVLQEVRVPVINNTACEGMYRSAGYVEHIPSIFICAGWKKGGFDSCEGDSGGPMVIQRPEDMRWVLAGVISWGIGCAEPNQPGVYTRISEFRGWINQILQF